MWHYFIDPILKAPTWGCLAMCIACSLVGALIFVRREVLLGETLSHAAYPGVMLAALLTLLPSLSKAFTFCILLGAAFFSYLAMKLLERSKKKWNMHQDSALSFVLTAFFGLGLTLASLLQHTHTTLYKQALVFLFGQAATITDLDMYFSITLALLLVILIALFYYPLQVTLLDETFAKTVGISTTWVNRLIYFMLTASIVIGIRSIGLFLLSGMFIAPAIAARQWTHRLSLLLILSAFIGAFGGLLGIYFSVEGPALFLKSTSSLSLATGPTILIVTCTLTFISLLFAPQGGWLSRGFKILKFKLKCLQENILKTLWHFSQKNPENQTLKTISQYLHLSKSSALVLCFYLYLKRDLKRPSSTLGLTEKGRQKAQNIVRLHRLWELYLVHIGVGKEKVHHHAEEMEHIITPNIEDKLLKLMKNPQKDPHNQPIPTSIRSPYL